MSEQGWREFLAADGVDDWVILHGGPTAVHVSNFRPVKRVPWLIRAFERATRGRVARQLLIESLLFAMAGGALGVALAWLGIRLLVAVAPADLPRVSAVALIPLTLWFVVSVARLNIGVNG